MKFNLKDYRNCKMLIGRNFGKIDRNGMGLEKWEKEQDEIIIEIDDKYTTIGSSYWLAMFGQSVRDLGEEEFREIYTFKCKKAFKESIDKFIDLALGK